MRIRRLLLLGVVGLVGVLCGGAMRAISDGEGMGGAPRDGGPGRAAGSDRAASNGLPTTSNRAGAVPGIDEIAAARGTACRLLLVRYLEAATLDDLKALHLSPWSETSDFRISHEMIYQRAVEIDAPAWIAWLAEGLSPELLERFGYRDQALWAWIRSDPEAAFMASADEAPWVRESAIKSLAKFDYERAIELLEKEMPHPNLIDTLQGEKLKALALTDRDGALDAALRLQAAGSGSAALKAVLDGWARSDPHAAWAWLAEHGGTGENGEIAQSIIGAMAKTDPAGARERLSALPGNAAKMRLSGEILNQQATTDFDGALASVMAETDPEMRNYLLTKLSPKLSVEEPLIYLQMMHEWGLVAGQENIDEYSMDSGEGGFNTSHGVDIDQFVHGAAMELAKEDPKQALAYLRLLSTNDVAGLTRISERWVEQDPLGAASWVYGLPSELEFSIDQQNSVMGAWAQRSPVDAAAFLVERGISPEQRHLASRVAEKWVEADPDSALRWSIDAMPGALPAALGALARFDPQRAAGAVDHLASAEDRARGIQGISTQWASIDPRATVEWLDSLPAGDVIDQPLNHAARSWVRQAPGEASEWIAEMEAGARRDQAVSGVVEELVSGSSGSFDFEAASVWVGTIGDEAIRARWQGTIQVQLGGAGQ